ncbi:hypothetical protein ACFFGR_19325 [Arthrobacter liuii]|nr:hypothetical protein [Arthrobacter liuii]
METPDYARFVQESIAADTVDDHILTEDQFYGVYLSWCALQAQAPGACASFWAAMSQQGIHERGANDHGRLRPGLRMIGPAAVDYILASQPSLL